MSVSALRTQKRGGKRSIRSIDFSMIIIVNALNYSVPPKVGHTLRKLCERNTITGHRAGFHPWRVVAGSAVTIKGKPRGGKAKGNGANLAR